MNITFQSSSFLDLCPDANQVMVYGYGHCKYKELAQSISALPQIGRVFTSDVGILRKNRATRTTVENRMMAQIPIEPMNPDLDQHRAFHQQTARECKAALVNIVIENYRRLHEKKPLIPVLFCIDIDEGTFNEWAPNVYNFTSKDAESNDLITHKEIRIAEKLCCDDSIDDKVREVAKNTFIFVKLLKKGDSFEIERLPAPWENGNWDDARDQRMLRSDPKPKFQNWRSNLNSLIDRIDSIYSIKKISIDM